MRKQSMGIGAAWVWMIWALVCLAANAAQAAQWNAFSDFSGVQSSSSVWQYGWAAGPAYNVFQPFAYYDAALSEWRPSISNLYPNISILHGSLTLGANYPRLDEAAVMRWVVPIGVTGISLNATFTGFWPNEWFTDPGPTNAGALVQLDGTPLWSATVQGNASVSYAGTVDVTVGQTIDFVLNFGPDRNGNFDRAKFTAEITSIVVPEPATGLAGLALTAGLALRRSRSVQRPNVTV